MCFIRLKKAICLMFSLFHSFSNFLTILDHYFSEFYVRNKIIVIFFLVLNYNYFKFYIG